MYKFIDLDTGLPALLNKVKTWVTTKLSAKQDSLVSGTNIKTVNNTSILGSGNISLPAGADGVTPHIDSTTGNWFVGTTNTGVHAQGPAGSVTVTDGVAEIAIVNDLTTGGTGDALSAEMGIILRGAIETLLSNLGDYAFPNGKPNISWVGSPFTITQNLTRVTSDCDYGTIYSGSQLTIHLSADDGCTLSAVTVKMRGVDVTNDYYDATTGTIDIPSVTGDIVITAVAVYPFDAKIEYLQSDGNQWIDTGIIAAANFKSEIKADILSPADSSWRGLLGVRDANARYAIPVGVKSTSSGGTLYSQFGISGNNFITASSSVVTGLHTFITQLTGSALSFSVDGVSGNAEITSVKQIVLPSTSQFLFSTHRDDSTVQSVSAKVYYCKIWNGGELVFDAIPVRVGQVGYMYDNVSSELLGNIGTGSFTLGNDITE